MRLVIKHSNLIMILCLFIAMVFYLDACTEIFTLLNQTNIQEPDVKISKIKMTGLSFDKVDLLFNIDINNPNAVGINLSGFDYDLQIEDKSFFNGRQDNGLAIKAYGSEQIRLPLTIQFMELYSAFIDLKNLDSVKYNFNTGLSFNLPMLGDIRIPIGKAGYIPALKLPSVSFHNLKLDKLKLTGADLNLQIKIDNPNAFTFILKNMDYKLNIAGSQWIDGKINQLMNISAKQETIIKIPISLNFLSMGQSVYNILKGDQSIKYKLNGHADLGSSLPLLENISIPFNQTGITSILK